MFSYDLERSDTGKGVRYYESYVFEDVLPEGAIFIAKDNPGWTYDEDSRVARFELLSNANNSKSILSKVILNLKFPGGKINKTYTNNVTLEARPLKKTDYESNLIVSDSIDFKLKAKVKNPAPTTYSFTKSIYNYCLFDVQSSKSVEQEWNVAIKNLADINDYPNMVLENVVIEDNNLDKNLKFTGVKFNSINENIFVGTVDVIVTYNDGTTEIVAENMSLALATRIDFSENVKSFSVKFTKNSYLKPGTTFNMYTLTEFVSPETKILKENETSKRLYNTANFSGNYVDGKTIKGSKNDYIDLRGYKPQVTTTKSIVNTANSFFIQDEIKYRLGTTFYNLDKDDSIETNKLVDILPVGIEYISGSAELFLNKDNITTEMNSGSFEPKVVTNYKGTGQTALVWDLQPFTSNRTIQQFNSGSASFHMVGFYIEYSTKITNLTNQGENINTAYLSWKNNDFATGNNLSADIYDLNNNGLVDDLITKVTAKINYIPPKELIVKKEVKGSLDNNYILPPAEGLSEIGDSVDYKFTLFNNSVSDYKTMYLVDLLPNINDKTTSIDQSLENPMRVNRDSSFKLNLNHEITPPTGFSVYYTTDKISNDIPEYTKNANWVSNLEDYSKVTAFKLVLNDGNIFKSGEERSFTVSFKVPKDYNLSKNDKVVNSFGVAVTNNLNFTESNMSTLKLTKYNVDGYIFDDFNVNGEYELSIDKPFKNYLVQLIDEDGKIVKDLDGNPYQSKTDENGYYSMDVYRYGNYKIKVITPDGYMLTTASEGDLSSHIVDESLGFTNKFDLNYQNDYERKNAGYYRDKSELSFEKELVNSKGEPLKNGDLFDFILKIDGQLYNGEALIDSETVDVIDGKISIRGGNKVIIKNIDKNSSYNIEEINNAEYLVTPSSSKYEGNLNESFINHIFINKYMIPSIDINVKKEWVNALNKKPNIKIQLYRNGEEYGDIIILKNGKNKYTWKNLDKTDENGNIYDYSVDEIDVPKGYKKEVKDFLIINTYIDKEKDDNPNTLLPETGQNILFKIGILLIISSTGIIYRKYLM